MKNLYLKVVERLKTVTALRWIDADEGQLEYYEGRPSVAFPCALVDIDLPQCADVGEKVQMVTARVTIRLAFEPLGQTNSTAPVSVQNKALARFDTVDAVFGALQGWDGNGLGDFSRVSQTTEKRDDPVKVVVQVWETNYTEEVTS